MFRRGPTEQGWGRERAHVGGVGAEGAPAAANSSTAATCWAAGWFDGPAAAHLCTAK